MPGWRKPRCGSREGRGGGDCSGGGGPGAGTNEGAGLENDEVSLADAIITFPVDPKFSSLNLAQAVLLVAYEWHKLASGGALPFAGERRSPPAERDKVLSFFDYIEAELEAVNFYPKDKEPIMKRNMRDIFH